MKAQSNRKDVNFTEDYISFARYLMTNCKTINSITELPYEDEKAFYALLFNVKTDGKNTCNT